MRSALVPRTLAAQDPEEPASNTLVSPIAGGWSLLVNLGPETLVTAIADAIEPRPGALFVFDPIPQSFHSYRPASPSLATITSIDGGRAFWLFVDPIDLDGDFSVWEQPAELRALTVTLRPGFNLAPWTGADGVAISEAVDGFPVRRAYFWDVGDQRFRTRDPALPGLISDDFRLEYGFALWLDLDGADNVEWQQN